MATILSSLDLVVNRLVTVVTTVGSVSTLAPRTTLGDAGTTEVAVITGSNITSQVMSESQLVQSITTQSTVDNFISGQQIYVNESGRVSADFDQIAYSSGVFNNQLGYYYTTIVANATDFGFQLYGSPGTYNFTVPEDASAVSILAIGGGGGGSQGSNGGNGGNGATAVFVNNYSTIPGANFTVNVGSGGLSQFGNAGTTGGDSSVYAAGSLTPIVYAGGGAGANLLYWNSNTVAFTFKNTTQTLGNITAISPTSQAITYSVLSGSLTGFAYNSTTGTMTYTTQGGSIPPYTVANLVIRAATTTQSITRNFTLIRDNAQGQTEFTTPGTYSWTAPEGVNSVCVVCIGGGGGGAKDSGGGAGGGGGGGLGWRNNIAVVPGQSYTVVVGSGGVRGTETVAATVGTQSYFISNIVVAGFGGSRGTGSGGGPGGSYVGDGGGNGGGTGFWTAGGGAGGYSGNGGNGGGGTGSGGPGTAGAGGGGGGGGATGTGVGAGGGGVGIYGQGASGAASPGASGGNGGSGGSNGSPGNVQGVPSSGGSFGGGGGTAKFYTAGDGAGGAVRIIWGLGRAFPSTFTANIA